MIGLAGGWLDRAARARAAARWAALAAGEVRPAPGDLPLLRAEAAAMQAACARFLHRSDARTRASRSALAGLALPPGTDWRWRPDILTAPSRPSVWAGPASGTRLGADATLWHDDPGSALILRQHPALSADDLPPHALTVETYGFSGRYWSLALALPAEACARLGQGHVLQVDWAAQAETALVVHARLNTDAAAGAAGVQRPLGPGLPGALHRMAVALDRGAGAVGRPVAAAWVDLIADSPGPTALVLRDVVLSTRPQVLA